MPLNIQLNKSTPSNFRLVFPIIPNQISLGAAEELILNIHSTVLPGISLDPGEMGWVSSKTKVPQSVLNYEEFSVDFIVDSEIKNWQILYNWLIFITNYKDKPMEHYRKFSVDASLQILDNFNKEVMRVSFIRTWPSSIGSVTLSNRDGESVLECSATFSYDYYEIK